MKKKLILTVLTVICLLTVQAQQYTEAVYLKNGSMIRGTVIEQVPGESLRIITSDGSIFVYRMDEVEKITKEQINKTPNIRSAWTGTKYLGYIDLGYIQNARTGGAGLSRVEFTTSHGLRLNPYIFVGAGVGVNYFYDVDAFTLPIFTTARATLPLGKTSIFFDGKIGYAMGLSSSYDSGLYWTPSAGVSVGKIDLSFGYVSQYIHIPDQYGGYNFNLGGLSFRVGVKF